MYVRRQLEEMHGPDIVAGGGLRVSQRSTSSSMPRPSVLSRLISAFCQVRIRRM